MLKEVGNKLLRWEILNLGLIGNKFSVAASSSLKFQSGFIKAALKGSARLHTRRRHTMRWICVSEANFLVVTCIRWMSRGRRIRNGSPSSFYTTGINASAGYQLDRELRFEPSGQQIVGRRPILPPGRQRGCCWSRWQDQHAQAALTSVQRRHMSWLLEGYLTPSSHEIWTYGIARHCIGTNMF